MMTGRLEVPPFHKTPISKTCFENTGWRKLQIPSQVEIWISGWILMVYGCWWCMTIVYSCFFFNKTCGREAPSCIIYHPVFTNIDMPNPPLTISRRNPGIENIEKSPRDRTHQVRLANWENTRDGYIDQWSTDCLNLEVVTKIRKQKIKAFTVDPPDRRWWLSREGENSTDGESDQKILDLPSSLHLVRDQDVCRWNDHWIAMNPMCLHLAMDNLELNGSLKAGTKETACGTGWCQS